MSPTEQTDQLGLCMGGQDASWVVLGIPQSSACFTIMLPVLLSDKTIYDHDHKFTSVSQHLYFSFDLLMLVTT